MFCPSFPVQEIPLCMVAAVQVLTNIVNPDNNYGVVVYLYVPTKGLFWQSDLFLEYCFGFHELAQQWWNAKMLSSKNQIIVLCMLYTWALWAHERNVWTYGAQKWMDREVHCDKKYSMSWSALVACDRRGLHGWQLAAISVPERGARGTSLHSSKIPYKFSHEELSRTLKIGVKTDCVVKKFFCFSIE